MFDPKALEELAQRFSALVAASPAGDLERNAKAMLGGFMTRLDLVTREDFDIQSALLAKTREQVATLEQRLAELEKRLG